MEGNAKRWDVFDTLKGRPGSRTQFSALLAAKAMNFNEPKTRTGQVVP